MRAPSIDFDLGRLDRQDRVDAWRSLHQDIYHLVIKADARDAVHASARVWHAGPLIIGHHQHSPSIWERTGPLIGKSPQDILILRLYFRGSSGVISGDVESELAPGAVYLFDFARERREITGSVEGISMAIPHSALGYDRAKHPGALSFDLNSPAGRMLQPNITALYQAAGEADADEATKLSDAFVALLRALIAPQLGDATDWAQFERAREVAMRDYVEHRLRGPMIKAEEVCAALGMSRSTLYRLLEPYGGFTRYVIGRKLEAAMMALGTRARHPGVVAEVSARFGFANQAHFSRAFRARFGMPPRDAVGVVLPSAEARRNGDALSLSLGALYARADPSA